GAEEFSFGDHLPRRSIGLRDYQPFFLPAVADPRGPGSIRAVESDSRVVVFHAVAGSEARGDGNALHLDAAVDKFQRVAEPRGGRTECEIALRGLDAHLLRGFHG